jgi:hypothetical protein
MLKFLLSSSRKLPLDRLTDFSKSDVEYISDEGGYDDDCVLNGADSTFKIREQVRQKMQGGSERATGNSRSNAKLSRAMVN